MEGGCWGSRWLEWWWRWSPDVDSRCPRGLVCCLAWFLGSGGSCGAVCRGVCARNQHLARPVPKGRWDSLGGKQPRLCSRLHCWLLRPGGAGLNWLVALVAGLVITMKTYWVALMVRPGVRKPIDREE